MGTACLAVAGISLLAAVNAEVNGEESAAPVETPGAEGGVKSERISPPGARPPAQRPPAPVTRPRPSPVVERGPEDMASPTFRLGGIPPFPGAPGESGTEEGDGDLQKQLANRRLAALERRVRAINRRVQSMGERGSTPEQVEAQKGRMEALLEEIRVKREEMGLGPFQLDEPAE